MRTTDDLAYLDNAATSYPKPRAVLDRMVETYARLGASPGRGGYDLAEEASRLVEDVRRQLAGLLGAPDHERVVFAANATDALNLAILGMCRRGDHVVSTRLEHNSVLRPLHHLLESGVIELDLVSFDGGGRVDPGAVERALRPHTRLVVATHASQVLGTVQPVAAIGEVCARRGVPLLVDAAQTAGQVPVRLAGWSASAVAFTGHKALLGPAGIGGLAVAPGAEIAVTRFGGTGVDSASLIHTRSYPHRLEAGTLNLPGIMGLSAGVAFLTAGGMTEAHRREMTLVRRLHAGLAGLPGVTVYSPEPVDDDIPVLSCGVEGMAPTDVGAILDADFGIAVRTGLHCAPLVHQDLGLLERGSVRFSLGHATTAEHVDRAVAAMEAIAASS